MTPPTQPRGARELHRAVIDCERCPRLRAHCLETARVKRAAFRDEEYWGKPVPTWGRIDAPLHIVGLAPAAHGANRTGRMFTGDRSGDFLFAALHRAGFANSPISRDKRDGTRLLDCALTAVAHCAPPGNKLLPEEIANCRDWLQIEWDLRRRTRVVLALGTLAFTETVKQYRRRGWLADDERPRFSHGLNWMCRASAPVLMASYHPSQQNTFTGRLTPAMLDSVFRRARRVIDGG